MNEYEQPSFCLGFAPSPRTAGEGRRVWIAMFNASSTSSVLRLFVIDQPTTFLE